MFQKCSLPRSATPARSVSRVSRACPPRWIKCGASTASCSETPPRPWKRRYHTKVWRCNMCDSTFKIKYSLQRETQPSRPGFPPSLWLPGVRLLLPSLGRDEETQEGGAQGQEGLLLWQVWKALSQFPPGWWPTRERFTTACSLSAGGRKILLTFSRTMKVAHFEDKPGRHEREERKAYIAAVLTANPSTWTALPPNPSPRRTSAKLYP